MIFWYNELVKTVKAGDHSSVDWNFLYSLRNAVKAGQSREFYELIASKADDVGGNIAAMYGMVNHNK